MEGIQEKIRQIRRAIFGKDVREAIAGGLELVAQAVDETEIEDMREELADMIEELAELQDKQEQDICLFVSSTNPFADESNSVKTGDLWLNQGTNSFKICKNAANEEWTELAKKSEIIEVMNQAWAIICEDESDLEELTAVKTGTIGIVGSAVYVCAGYYEESEEYNWIHLNPVDYALSQASPHPVANLVITEALSRKANKYEVSASSIVDGAAAANLTPGATKGDYLITTAGLQLYTYGSYDSENEVIYWRKIWDASYGPDAVRTLIQNERMHFYEGNIPSTDPTDFTNLKLGDFCWTYPQGSAVNLNDLYVLNQLSSVYANWVPITPTEILSDSSNAPIKTKKVTTELQKRKKTYTQVLNIQGGDTADDEPSDDSTDFSGIEIGDYCNTVVAMQGVTTIQHTWKVKRIVSGVITWVEVAELDNKIVVPKPSVSEQGMVLVVNSSGQPEWQMKETVALFPQKKIPANGDVNSSDYRAVGSYGCSTTTARTLSNIPSGLDTGFILHTYAPMDDKTEAFETNGNWLYRYQELTTFNGMKKWVRYVQSNGNGEWTYGEWKAVYDLSQTIPKYELIKEEIITSAEPSSTGILWEDLNSEYDDVLITSNNVLGSANGNNYVVAIRTTSNTTISGNVYATINNIMSDTTPKNTYQKIERLNESLYDYRLGGAIQSNNIIPFPSNSSYSDKIYRVSVTTGNNNTFTQGTFRIYGRKRF